MYWMWIRYTVCCAIRQITSPGPLPPHHQLHSTGGYRWAWPTGARQYVIIVLTCRFCASEQDSSDITMFASTRDSTTTQVTMET